MVIASARYSVALPAVLSLSFCGSGVAASDRVETRAAVRIVGSAGITVTNSVSNSAPLQALLLTATIAPTTLVFTATGASPVSVSGTGAGPASVAGTSRGTPAGGGTGASPFAGGEPDAGGAIPTADGGGPPVVAFGGSGASAVIDGDAVSVNVGSVTGGSASENASVTVVIAQYN